MLCGMRDTTNAQSATHPVWLKAAWLAHRLKEILHVRMDVRQRTRAVAEGRKDTHTRRLNKSSWKECAKYHRIVLEGRRLMSFLLNM